MPRKSGFPSIRAARAPAWPANRWAAASSSISPSSCAASCAPMPNRCASSPASCMLGVESTLGAAGPHVRAQSRQHQRHHDRQHDRHRRLGQQLAAVRLGAAARRKPASGFGRRHGDGIGTRALASVKRTARQPTAQRPPRNRSMLAGAICSAGCAKCCGANRRSLPNISRARF